MKEPQKQPSIDIFSKSRVGYRAASPERR